jgi:hypothetical protein
MKTILSEARETPLKTWPGLFDLYQNSDGTFRAELGPVTSRRSRDLYWKVTTVEGGLAAALIALSATPPSDFEKDIPEPKFTAPFGSSNIFEIHRAANLAKALTGILKHLIIAPLSSSLGKEIECLADPTNTPAQRTKAKQTLQQRFEKALNAIEKKGDRKAHGNTAAVEALFESGKTRKMPLAWAAIQIARELVESTQGLPTKGEVQRRVEAVFPDANGLSEAKWRQAWKDAALDSLPHDEAWTLPRARQRKSTRRKNRSK